jgi:hypothetical protein
MPPLSELDANIRAIYASYEIADKPATSKKRKSDGPPPMNPDDINLDGVPIDWNANQVRTRIRSYLNSGEMKVGEFQNELGVSSKGYGEFMKQSGPEKGTGSNTYYAAFEFFKKRELAGVKMPRKKTKTEEKTKDGKGGEKDKYDVSGVNLDGEQDERVPIFDTCDEVRRKINAHLRDAPTTNAGFVRQIAQTFPSAPEMAGRHLTAFLGKKGPTNGAENPVFYAAYVYFEKLRLKNKKPKSKKRQEMEEIWGREGGMERCRQPQRVWARADESWTIDSYGRNHIGR